MFKKLWMLFYSVWDAITNYGRLGGLNNKSLFLIVLEARKSILRVPAW